MIFYILSIHNIKATGCGLVYTCRTNEACYNIMYAAVQLGNQMAPLTTSSAV